ncbi:hypothetical protein KC349_g201 [Hortaea werneckii]|nr:hypothetical protein KC349_g201 [Hortaea werneckii]
MGSASVATSSRTWAVTLRRSDSRSSIVPDLLTPTSIEALGSDARVTEEGLSAFSRARSSSSDPGMTDFQTKDLNMQQDGCVASDG